MIHPCTYYMGTKTTYNNFTSERKNYSWCSPPSASIYKIFASHVILIIDALKCYNFFQKVKLCIYSLKAKLNSIILFCRFGSYDKEMCNQEATRERLTIFTVNSNRMKWNFLTLKSGQKHLLTRNPSLSS